MKIAYVVQFSSDLITPPFDGPANHIRQISMELAKRGHDVRLIFGLNNLRYYSDDLEHFGILPVPKLNRFLNLAEKVIRKIQTIIRFPYFAWFESHHFARQCLPQLQGFDLIIERTSWMAYGTTLMANKLKIPIIQEFNGDPLIDLDAKKIAPQGIQRWLAIKIYRYTLRKAAMIIATGEGWRDMLIHNWKINENQIKVIENGSVLVDILDRDQLKPFKIAEEAPTNPVEIVFLGGFYAWHGTDLLIEAFTRCLRTRPDIYLTLIGAGVGLVETKERVVALNLDHKITFPGQLSYQEYAPILATADIAVSPVCGRKEYSCLKLFDYKAAGLAIISSGENEQPATLIHNKTGLIVAPCDVNALEDAMLSLIGNPGLRRKLGYHARLDAEQNNSWRHTAAEVESLMTKLLMQRKWSEN
ncbi:MAG: hypothetical protein BGO78_13565 [Chloroflexi bacterium 44-23]|nr:MAG: hypothetical protein BGO78_13565 [Chloroflexi bacterium 44-23]